MPRLSKKRFFKWAREHGDEPVIKRVGSTRTQCCPMARYARWEGFRRPEFTSTLWDHRNAKGLETPSWASCVVAAADRHPDADSRPISDLIRELRKEGIRP